MKKLILITLVILFLAVAVVIYADDSYINFNIKMLTSKYILLKEALLYDNPMPADPNGISLVNENIWARQTFYKMVDRYVYRTLKRKDEKNHKAEFVERKSDGTAFLEDNR